MAVYDRLLAQFPEYFQTVDFTTYLQALARVYQPVADLAEDGVNGEPGWSQILDIDRAPFVALPWLAQFIGARIPPDVTTDLATRNYIKDQPGWKRGSPSAIISAAKLGLTGTKSVTLIERNSSPYHFLVVTLASETDTRDWPARNFLVDASFEVGLGALGALTNATAARVNTQANSGTWSAFLTRTTASYASVSLSPTAIPISAGLKYVFSAYVRRGVGAGNAQVVLIYLDGNLNVMSTISGGSVLPSNVGFTRLTASGTAPAGAVYASLTLEFNGGVVAAGDTYWVDDAQFEQGPAVTAYRASTATVRGGSYSLRRLIDMQKPAVVQYETMIS